MVQPIFVRDDPTVTKLWCHEVSRVFHDRLINDEDRNWFYDLMVELIGRHFKTKFTKDELFI